MTLDKHPVAFWNSIFARFGELQHSRRLDEAKQELLADVRTRFAEVPDDCEWFRLTLLRDDDKNFVAWFFTHLKWLPELLYEPMIRAAIEEVDPSRNRLFVGACLAAFGHRRVNESLLDVLEHGNDFEKAGAANALYWAQVPLVFSGNVVDYRKTNATAESQAAYDAIEDLRHRQGVLMLREFVNNTNVDVRRAVVAHLVLDPSEYDDETKQLVQEAIRTAREHDDEYIRQRVEVQLGNAHVYKALPHRRPVGDGS